MRLIKLLVLFFFVLCSSVSADTVTYYFDAYSVYLPGGADDWWDPSYMVDGSLSNYATAYGSALSSGSNYIYQLNTSNTGTSTELGTISAVQLRVYGYKEEVDGIGVHGGTVRITPKFGGSSEGDAHTISLSTTAGWTSYVTITTDTNAPSSWSWADVDNLDAIVTANFTDSESDVEYISKVEILVTYSRPAQLIVIQ